MPSRHWTCRQTVKTASLGHGRQVYFLHIRVASSRKVFKVIDLKGKTPDRKLAEFARVLARFNA